jgi:thioredoxin 1
MWVLTMKIKVTAKNYPQEVLNSEVPVLVEFRAVWCGKCAMMEDVVNELSDEYKTNIKVCQIDINESEVLAAEFEISVVPTFVVFKGGKPVAAASGILSKKVLKDMINI